MKLVDKEISIQELMPMSTKMFGEMVKAVVDIEKEIMVVDAMLHSDQEEWLLENESKQENLWGINIHPNKFPDQNWIEFDSMINLRPSQGNRSRSVDDPKIRERIIKVVTKLVKK